MAGHPSKRKGYRVEHQILQLHLAAGLPCRRVPLSGGAKDYPGDLEIGPFKAEVKARKGGAGFKVLEGWLGEMDLLFLKRDRQPPLVVMPWSTYLSLLEDPPW